MGTWKNSWEGNFDNFSHFQFPPQTSLTSRVVVQFILGKTHPMCKSSNPGNTHMEERAERAAKIIGRPERYKICEGCDSILILEAVTCPNCHSYRFNANVSEVVTHARLLANRVQTSVAQEDMY